MVYLHDEENMGCKRQENEEPGYFGVTSKQNKEGCYLCETDKEMIDIRVRKELGVKKALQAKVSEGYNSNDIDFRHR